MAGEPADVPDVVVVGSGIAGLFVATRCARAGLATVVVTKKKLRDSSTNWAQGGIAASLSPSDVETHIADTIAAGAGLCDEAVVRMVAEEAAERIADLVDAGVRFDANEEGFDLTMEGGHTARRILHAKDATGAEIERALIAEARASPNLTLLEAHMAVDLILEDREADVHRIVGIWALDPAGEVQTIAAQAVILATGGAGMLWERTTNPPVATADGMAMAHRAGAKLRDLEFVQFHPTALAGGEGRPFLISEALRGEGAVLMDAAGYAAWSAEGGDAADYSYMREADPRGSLATRDIVARATDAVMKRDGVSHVWLVTEHLDAERLHARFPNITAQAKRRGLQIGIDPLPVAPAAHYMVGGIAVDADGAARQQPACCPEMAFPGLYAIGETACTGLHGANRLASNSLLEAVVYSHRCAARITQDIRPREGEDLLPAWRAEGLAHLVEHAPLRADFHALRASMSDDVGLVKRDARLERALRRLDLLHREVDDLWRNALPTQEIIELRNMVLIARLVTGAAYHRRENIGLHHNLDCV